MLLGGVYGLRNASKHSWRSGAGRTSAAAGAAALSAGAAPAAGFSAVLDWARASWPPCACTKKNFGQRCHGQLGGSEGRCTSTDQAPERYARTSRRRSASSAAKHASASDLFGTRS